MKGISDQSVKLIITFLIKVKNAFSLTLIVNILVQFYSRLKYTSLMILVSNACGMLYNAGIVI
jgi:hypothetical protein